MLTFRDLGVHSLYQHVSIPSILVFMQILGFIQFIGFTIISFVFDVVSVRSKGYKIGSIFWEYCSQWKQWTNATSFSGGPYTGSKTKLAFWGRCRRPGCKPASTAAAASRCWLHKAAACDSSQPDYGIQAPKNSQSV
jgi:hypothetical protein